MNKRKSLLNVSVAIFFKILLLLGGFLVRRYLIRFVGNDVNGIDSLYVSIIGMLAVAELGIGDAITFCMYKPIVKGEIQKVASLYRLFTRIYITIGGIIAIGGCIIMPFLPLFAKGYSSVDINLYLTFGLMLISTIITYIFSAKTSLMNAYRDNYITTTITSIGQLLQQVLQIVVLFITQSFACYLICRIAAALTQWIITAIVTRRKYSFILKSNVTAIDLITKKEIVKNVKALFMHKIGGILVNTVDSLIISAFIGVTILGKYSNYTTIMTAMVSTITLFFSPLTSTIGHIFAQDSNMLKKHFDFFYNFNFSLGCIFFLGYYSVIDDLIILLFGTGLELSKAISFIITLNYFVQFMRQATRTFKDASGSFYYDRWKPLIEGFSNLVLSICCVIIFQKVAGDEFAVVGVIVATIITNLVICHIVEPFVLYKHIFHKSAKKYYLRNYCYISVFVLLLIVLDFCMVSNENKWVELFVNGSISVGISLVCITIIIMLNKNYKYYIKDLIKNI